MIPAGVVRVNLGRPPGDRLFIDFLVFIVAYGVMTNIPSESNSSDSSDEVSFFEMATGESVGSATPSRTRELKRMLFDLAYLVMNADGTEHISERMLVRELEGKMEREGSVDVEARGDELESLLKKGTGAIQERVKELAREVADHAGDQTPILGKRYLDFLKGLIVVDATVTEEEAELFQVLCDEWGIEEELPR